MTTTETEAIAVAAEASPRARQPLVWAELTTRFDAAWVREDWSTCRDANRMARRLLAEAR